MDALRCALVPEVCALLIGLWVQDKQIWRVSRWQIVLLLPAIALAAVLTVRYLPYGLPLQMALVFAAVVALLMLLQSTLTPAFAVGLLPVMLGTTTFVYPLAIIALALLLTLGQYAIDAWGLRTPTPLQHAKRHTWSNVARWLALLAALLPLIVAADMMKLQFIIAPPLVVTFVELCNSKGGFRNRLGQTWLMLTLAAAVGSLCRGLLCGMWDAPLPVATVLTEALVLVMFALFGKRFAPAAAMALIPFVMPEQAAAWQPLYTAIGATYVIIVVRLLFTKEEEK